MQNDYNYLLVVDDHAGICRLLFEIFTDEGYFVEVASSGAEALGKIRSRKPMLVVLDVNMPGMSGLDTLAEIRKTTPELPVIMLSAYTEKEIVAEALRNGTISHCISKPFDLKEICQEVKDLLTANKRDNCMGSNCQLITIP